MTLLHVAVQTMDPTNIFVLHVNHKTRSQCEKEQVFVEKVCEQYGANFLGKTLAKKPQKNRESFWRAERERCKTWAIKKTGAKRALSAHHATDLVETMLWRLVKGTGVSGLSPFETETKPFWTVSKAEIEKYAREKKLQWWEDASNLNTNFDRNLIRQEVLPELRNITPNLEKVFVAEARHFSSVETFLRSRLPSPLEKKMSLKTFLTLPEILQTEFLRSIARQTPSSSEIDDCLRWLRGTPPGGSAKKIGGTPLRLEQNKLRWD
ncbi:MAG: tRNA lysidine(34) synthetase TilS [Candidatus Gracilibacteria bacterium]|nr:tRNA lysidine(34) synthetase TilS [Candidatus Gracilibacteria bacterium]